MDKMHLNITTQQAELLRVIRQTGKTKKSTLAEKTGKSINAIRNLIASLQEAKHVIEYRAGSHESSIRFHGPSAAIKAMSELDFEAAIQYTIANQEQLRAQRKKPKKIHPRVLKMMQDEEVVDFIRLNHNYLTHGSIAIRLGISLHDMECMLEKLGMPILDEDQLDEQAHQIISSVHGIRFIPAGSEIKDSKIGGTTIHMPGNQPGITRITRYYGC